MKIDCYLITNGEFKPVVIPEKLLTELSKNLRNSGKETVHFTDKSIVVEGIYIPARGIEGTMMIVHNT